jgi:hypothetical protein
MKIIPVILLCWALFMPCSQGRTEEVIDKNFLLVSAYLVGTSIFDVETTFSAIKNGAQEGNPILKPFVKRGRAATYGVILASDAVILLTSYYVKKSKDPVVQKRWWIIPTIVGTSHGIAGTLNLRFVL